MKQPAIFLDRDGTITDMVYYPEHALVDSPCSPSQLDLIQGVGTALRSLQELGYKLILISNQPGIAKGHFTTEIHQRIVQRLDHLLSMESVALTAQYYCVHHPQARLVQYRRDCGCRKPEPGLIQQAAREHNLSLANSITIGDSLTDVMAGQRAGTKAILLTTMNSLISRLIADLETEPDLIARNLLEAVTQCKRSSSPAVLGLASCL